MTSTSSLAAPTEPAPAPGSPLRRVMTTLALDLGLPVAAYFAAEALGASTFVSLLVGTVASGLRLVWVALRQRRLDAFSTFLLVVFGAGLVLSFVTGDVRFMMVKDCATSAVVGLTMVVSCLIGRPLAYYAALRMAGAEGRERILASAQDDELRRRWYRVSLVWGLALLTDTALRIAIIYLLPVHLAANVSQVLMILVYTLLFGWTVRNARRAAA
ncbi:VC0807 family protein [Nocardia alni]|uniref:VC0807 family protein n=1 Tax=Nocardia alni TaxID=2815723 RepID=UPI001C22196E|nr:VC0807 family protein [Nocardia alni]